MHNAFSLDAPCMVPKAGLEPARYFYRRILSPLRLPFRHLGKVMEAPPRLELGVKALQASALPLGYGAILIFMLSNDFLLKKMVGATGLEPVTLCL